MNRKENFRAESTISREYTQTSIQVSIPIKVTQRHVLIMIYDFSRELVHRKLYWDFENSRTKQDVAASTATYKCI